MTRRYFELIAQVIRSEADRVRDYTHPEDARGALAAIAQDFAGRLYRINPRFDRERFLKACGVGED